MRFEFQDAFLEALAFDPSASSPWPPAVLRLYRRRLQQIDAAQGLSDLLASRALDARAVPTRGSGAFSLRIDDAHRLIVQVAAEDLAWRASVLEVRASGKG